MLINTNISLHVNQSRTVTHQELTDLVRPLVDHRDAVDFPQFISYMDQTCEEERWCGNANWVHQWHKRLFRVYQLYLNISIFIWSTDKCHLCSQLVMATTITKKWKAERTRSICFSLWTEQHKADTLSSNHTCIMYAWTNIQRDLRLNLRSLRSFSLHTDESFQ